MRPHIAAALVLLALLPAACSKKPSAANKAPAAAMAPNGPGIPGPRYATTDEGNAKFLADYAALPGVTKTADGLLYRVIKSGNGKTAIKSDDMVTVLYKGQLIDGTVIDHTTMPQNPADPDSGPRTFPAGELIPGWVEALSRMKEGDEWELAIPYPLAYGEEGKGPVPPKQTLVFSMSLLKVDLTP